MKRIDQDVPAGKVLEVAGLRFVGPCRAKARVSHKAEVRLADAPKPKPRPTREIKSYDDLTEREKLSGLLETLSATQKGKIVAAIRAKQSAWTAPARTVPAAK